jgi:hypothetical protein
MEESAMKAPKAAVSAMLRQAKIMTTNTGNQTARMGTLCFRSIYFRKSAGRPLLSVLRGAEILTWENHGGSAPSRAQAQVRRETEAILARFTDNEITRSPQTIAVAALTDPVACMQISMIGKLEFKASSSEPMVKRRVMTIP